MSDLSRAVRLQQMELKLSPLLMVEQKNFGWIQMVLHTSITLDQEMSQEVKPG